MSTMGLSTRRILIISAGISVLLITALVAATVYLSTRLCHAECKSAVPLMSRAPFVQTLEYFNTSDALNVTWNHRTNSKADLETALDGNYMMLEADVVLEWWGLPNQTNTPIMAHPPAKTSDNTLSNWLDRVLHEGDRGLKLDFKSLDAVAPSLQIVAKRAPISVPVWVNANILRGPGGGDPIDAKRFVKTVNDHYPSVTLSLGWTTECCSRMYGIGMMEDMWNICKNIPNQITFPARAALLMTSWPQFKWLLNKSPNFSITVWTSAHRDDWEGATEYDMLYVRNDCEKKSIYYDLPGPKYEQFKRLSQTAGSPVHHFNIQNRDAARVTWYHAANNKARLQQALQGEYMMIEADVLLYKMNIPVMAHPPEVYNNITLETWLTDVLKTNKGIKLDFKTIDAVEPSLLILNKLRDVLNRPVWLNADILIGPKGAGIPVDPNRFLELCDRIFPEATFSLGWKTGFGAEEEGYSRSAVEEMHSICKSKVRQPVTFPIRAVAAKKSWSHLEWLLEQSRSYTLTLWTTDGDNVTREDMEFIREYSEHSRVYFDLPADLMPDISK